MNLTEVQDQLDELSLCNGFWAGELTLFGCATLFDLDLDREDLELLADALWDEWDEDDLEVLDQALAEREAEADVLTFSDLEVVAERFGAEVSVLAACHADLCQD